MGQAVENRTVGIIDYDAGNTHSLESAFEYVGAHVVRVRTEGDMVKCTHLVLPGVGAFGFCAERLDASGITPGLRHWALELGRPLLGICVGMQLLGDHSEESPGRSGLAWIGGEISRLSPKPQVRVPHVGWNAVRFERSFGMFAPGSKADFYFDHSFAYGEPRTGEVIGYCKHGREFSAHIEKDNITAVQFHPEKSQESGLRFLNGFLSR
jgi:glutamine amidotransferase